MKWIVTGGCGFIGTNAALSFHEQGDEVVVIDNLLRPYVRRNLTLLKNLRLECHVADVRDSVALERIVRRHADADCVLHLAGQVSLLASLEDPKYDFETNVAGTLNVLEAVRRWAPNAIILYASTNKVYGDLSALRIMEEERRYRLPGHPHGLDEFTPLDFHGGYGCSKGAADQYVLDFHRTYGMRTVSLRQSSVYGGHQYATADQGWLAYFVYVGLRGERFQINGNGKQVRDALHSRDLLALYRRCVERIDDAAGLAFNIGGGPENTSSLLELFDLLEGSHGLTMRYSCGPPRPSDQRVFVADVRRAQKLLDWQPTIGLNDGLWDLIDWTCENRE